MSNENIGLQKKLGTILAQENLARFLHVTKLWRIKILTPLEYANILTYYIRILEYSHIDICLSMGKALLQTNVKK